MSQRDWIRALGGLHSKVTMADRVAVSVQASQDQQNNSVKHSETVSLLCQGRTQTFFDGTQNSTKIFQSCYFY